MARTQPSISRLSELGDALNQWRAQGSPGRFIPDWIRQKAVSFLSEYTANQVIHALGINSKMLKQWQDNQLIDAPAPAFQVLPPTDKAITSAHLTVSLQDARDCQWRIEGHLPIPQWGDLIRQLTEVES